MFPLTLYVRLAIVHFSSPGLLNHINGSRIFLAPLPFGRDSVIKNLDFGDVQYLEKRSLEMCNWYGLFYTFRNKRHVIY